MSWSISCIGKPENVIAALEKFSGTQTGYCKDEFDAALPHIVGLVNQNFADPRTSYNPPVIQLDASGSGTSQRIDGPDTPPKPVQRTCKVEVKPLYTTLV